MNQVLNAVWWLIAILLLIRWVKGMRQSNSRTGRVYSNRIEWD